MERIQGYIDIEHEPVSVKERAPPAAWPKSGHLSVEKLSARYSKGGPKVLHDISFEVKPGERIGIGMSFNHPRIFPADYDQLGVLEVARSVDCGHGRAFELIVFAEFPHAGPFAMHSFRGYRSI